MTKTKIQGKSEIEYHKNEFMGLIEEIIYKRLDKQNRIKFSKSIISDFFDFLEENFMLK